MSFWVNICYSLSYIIFEVQMFLIWLYFSRKSDLHTTIIDLVNRDTLIVHNIYFSMGYLIIALLYQAKIGPPDIPHLIILTFSISTNFVAMICFTYYSLGIAIRFYFVMKHKTCLSEDYTDEETRIFIRIAAVTFSGTIAGARTLAQHYPGFYYEITHTIGVDPSGLPIVILILFTAIIINAVGRLCIFLEKRKIKDSHEKDSSHFRSSFILSVLVCLALCICFIQLRPQIFGDYIYAVRFLWLGTSLNVVPLMYMIVTKDCINFIKSRFGIRTSSVQPE